MIPQVAGILGAVATTSKIESWYRYLDKPAWAPPNWVFGPVWTILYLLMGVGLYSQWKGRRKLTDKVFRWFWIQLGLNVLWSWLFFWWEKPGWALIEIVLMLAAIVKMKKDIPYQIPYLTWVSFATLLNAGVWWLNR